MTYVIGDGRHVFVVDRSREGDTRDTGTTPRAESQAGDSGTIQSMLGTPKTVNQTQQMDTGYAGRNEEEYGFGRGAIKKKTDKLSGGDPNTITPLGELFPTRM